MGRRAELSHKSVPHTPPVDTAAVAKAQITTLEAEGYKLMRAAMLGDKTALTRLQEIDDKINKLKSDGRAV